MRVVAARACLLSPPSPRPRPRHRLGSAAALLKQSALRAEQLSAAEEGCRQLQHKVALGEQEQALLRAAAVAEREQHLKERCEVWDKERQAWGATKQTWAEERIAWAQDKAQVPACIASHRTDRQAGKHASVCRQRQRNAC